MKLPKDFKEFIELMISESVKFVMIGGFAYNLYRNPRATGDFDFFLDATPINETRLRCVLEKFGFAEALPPDGEPLLKSGKIIMLGRSPFRIDLLNQVDGLTADEIFSTSLTFEIDGLSIPVIAPKQLLINKRAIGRAKDRADAEELQQWLEAEENSN